MLAKSDHLVVLANDLRSTFAKIERKGSLVSTQVIDVENELLRKIFWRAPYDPTYTRIDLEGVISTCCLRGRDFLAS